MRIVKTALKRLSRRLSKRSITRARFPLGAALLTAVLCSGCGAKTYTSAASVSQAWLEAKTAIQIQLDAPQNTPASPMLHNDFVEKINTFVETLERFLASPVGALYAVHRPAEMRALETVSPLSEQLKGAVPGGGTNGLLRLVLEIDKAVELLQRVDARFSDTSQRNYFYLFFFFSLLIIIIVAAMGALYNRLEKTEASERRTLSFSRETVITQEEERSRIARELHDTVAQDLWRLSFQTDSISRTADAAERSRLCAEVSGGQKELMRRIRSICDTLVPPDFRRRGLFDAVRGLCYDFERHSGIVCEALIPETLALGALDSGAQLQCFRVVQECLANIEKHSGASKVSVFIGTRGNGTLEIKVSDNGRGFSPPGKDSAARFRAEGHYGLWSMFGRAALLGGTLVVESAPARGTVVSLEIPLFANATREGKV